MVTRAMGKESTHRYFAGVQSRAEEIILVHNHTHGNPAPSDAGRGITDRLDRALKMIDVRIVGHVIVGESMYSFAAHGLLRS